MNKLPVIIGIIGLAVAFLVFPILLDASQDMLTNDVSDVAEGVTTGVGEATAIVELSDPLYDDSTYWVSSISSNITETPVPNSYNATSQELTVGDLTANTTRTLTVGYATGATENYTGLGSIIKVAPLIVFVGLLFGSGLSLWFGVRRKAK